MRRRDVSFEVEGIKLVGQVYIPEEQPMPAVCLCHGVPRGGISDPQDRGYPALAERLCKAGLATLIFNFRGTGDSGGNFDLLGWVRDLEVALDFLCSMREVDGRISVMGFSGGAAVSVYVAAKDPRVSSVIACACPTSFRFAADAERAKSAIQHFRNIGIIRDENFPPSLEAWVDGFQQVSPQNWIDKISPRPLLLIHGTKDEVVEPSSAWALYERAGEPKDILIIEGAGHRLRLEERAIDGALNWLKIQLGRD